MELSRKNSLQSENPEQVYNIFLNNSPGDQIGVKLKDIFILLQVIEDPLGVQFCVSGKNLFWNVFKN